jgi:hypothetical protein
VDILEIVMVAVASSVVVDVWRLDLYDLGAHLTKLAHARWPGSRPTEIDDLDMRQRQR